MAFSFLKKQNDLPSWVTEQLASNPSWNVVFAGKRLCPYCSTSVVSAEQDDPKEAFLKHLSVCGQFDQPPPPPQEPGPLLQHAIRRFVKGRLSKGGSWVVFTADRCWVCPYTGKVTPIQIGEDRRVNTKTINQMVEYLHADKAFNPCKRVKEESYLRKIVRELTEKRELEERIRRNLTADPLLRYTDRQGRWVCPWCRDPLASVDVSTDFAMRVNAPSAITRHLSSHCAAYKAKRERATREELDQIFGSLNAPVEEEDTSDSTLLHTALLDELRSDIENMRHSLAQNKAASVTSQQMENSLQKARERQLKMLPSTPEIAGLDIDTWYSPCDSVSGDFYDFIQISDTSYGILVGDVSGHGIEAALIMSMAKKSLQMYGRSEPDPVKTLCKANADLVNELQRGTFLTVFYIVFDMKERVMHCCRAGHNPAILVNPSNPEEVVEVTPGGIGVGLAKDAIFSRALKCETIPLVSGQTIVLYTDGISEAKNAKSEEYGFDRFKEVVARFSDHEPRYLMHLIRGDVENFSKGHPAEDDMTIIVLKVE